MTSLTDPFANKIHVLVLLTHFLRRAWARCWGFRIVAVGIEDAHHLETKDV